ncbi:hypothetical protein ACFFX0_05395 [Citricoccus parietis]|uniref:Secreted protein n=1 Tax=Citricoccus parietis TaxID=592307 RepID=A0ABV5FVD9_9MICC
MDLSAGPSVAVPVMVVCAASGTSWAAAAAVVRDRSCCGAGSAREDDIVFQAGTSSRS